jgi:hypothetical protein
MKSFDISRADSNTERSQYKHSELKTMRAVQEEASEQDSEGDREDVKEMRDGEAREERMAAPHASNR